MSKKSVLKLVNLEKAFGKLSQFLLVKEPSELERTGIIKAFEYTFELFWKTFKAQAEIEGLQVASPKAAVAYAYQAGLVVDEAVWLDMLEKRNLGVHTYNEDQAKEIYLHIRDVFAQACRDVLERLKVEVNK